MKLSVAIDSGKRLQACLSDSEFLGPPQAIAKAKEAEGQN